jgi:hypothetical protein
VRAGALRSFRIVSIVPPKRIQNIVALRSFTDQAPSWLFHSLIDQHVFEEARLREHGSVVPI